MRRSLLEPLPSQPALLDLRETQLDEWLDGYVALSGAALDHRDTHAAILHQIPGAPRFATLRGEAGTPVACGLAVREANVVGLFDIVTDRAKRNQGFGSALVSGLLAWARTEGAEDAYLQVVATNEPAIHLYRKLGFTDAYHYWYRVPPA
jgi:GNAT superfamily N-acetyltransferase